MRILATITPVFQTLVDNWLLPSLARLGMRDDLVVVVDHTPEAQGSGDFRSNGFDGHIANKLELAAKWAERESEPFLLTDADIVYIRPFLSVALQDAGDLDFLLSQEWPERNDHYNIGQVVITPSSSTADFLRRIARDLRSARVQDRFGRHQSGNQDHFNAELCTTSLRHSCLPQTFANTGILRHLGPDRIGDLYSYHATDTRAEPGLTSLEKKHRRLAEVASSCGLKL